MFHNININFWLTFQVYDYSFFNYNKKQIQFCQKLIFRKNGNFFTDFYDKKCLLLIILN